MFAVIAATFIAVFLLVVTGFFLFRTANESPAAELKRRLRRMAGDASRVAGMPDDLRSELQRETPELERLVNGIPGYRMTADLLDRAGLSQSPERFFAALLALSLLCGLAAFVFTRQALLALLLTVLVHLIAYLYLQNLCARRLDRFTEQLPEALTMLSRSLRAGHSLTSSLELVGTEMSDPLGGLFKAAYEQQKYGLRLGEALGNMLLRMESLDLRFFVMIVAINSEIGGNLSEILDKLATTIRERLKLRRQVRVLTAQGRLSGYILAALPIVTFLLLQYVLLPGYEDVFINDVKGRQMLGLAIVAQIAGYLIIRRVVNIRI